jgi:CheY-like chemotaxis protein
VEDDALVRLSLSAYLQAMGFDILEAESAEDAEALVALDTKIDLLVTDVVLRGMRGTTLAQRLSEERPDLPVVFTTANPELVQAEGLSIRVLRKPFSREELADAVAGLLSSPPAARPDRPARVLVVEDEPASRLALASLLEDEGYDVTAVDRPSRALTLAGEAPFDAMISDIRLPEMTGDALAERLRTSHPGLRVMYVSGLADVPPGADAFLTKPVDFDVLLEALEEMLARPAAAPD